MRALARSWYCAEVEELRDTIFFHPLKEKRIWSKFDSAGSCRSLATCALPRWRRNRAKCVQDRWTAHFKRDLKLCLPRSEVPKPKQARRTAKPSGSCGIWTEGCEISPYLHNIY